MNMARVKQVRNKINHGKNIARRGKDISKMLKERQNQQSDTDIDQRKPQEILRDIRRKKLKKGHRVRDILKPTSLLNTPLPQPIPQHSPQQFSPIQVKDIPLPPLSTKSDSQPIYENISPIPDEQINNFILDMPIDFFGFSPIPVNTQLTELCDETITSPPCVQEKLNLTAMVDEIANNIIPTLSPIPTSPPPTPPPPPPPPSPQLSPVGTSVILEEAEEEEEEEEEAEPPPLKKKCFKRFLIYMKRFRRCDEPREEKRTIIYSNYDQDIICTQHDKYRELETLYRDKLYINKKYLQWGSKKVISDLMEKRYIFDNNREEKKRLECKKKTKSIK